MPRFFTLSLAESLLPKLEPLLRQAIALKSSYEKAEAEIRSAAQRVAMLGGAQVDRNKLAGVHSRREATVVRLKETLEEIAESGCLVKDLDSGLLDFPCSYRGEEVYLCWKLGEEGISHWHRVEDGFRGRQPIDREFLDNHEGDTDR
jgi:hypothetical protein